MVTLSAAIGKRLGVLREKLGLRQDDVASAGRALGLRWSRVAVARLETGVRRLETGEFLMLPEVLMVASMRVRGQGGVGGLERIVELADLLPESGVVALTRECRVQVRDLRAMVGGRYGEIRLADLDVPLLRDQRKKQTAAVATIGRLLARDAELHAILNTVWATAPATVKASALQEAGGEAEQKAAPKLGVHPAAVALAAQRRWGQSLTAERDKRVLKRSSGESPRRVQAIRGHVTRTLIGELRPLLQGAKETS
jgi:hypothetical protein